MKLDTITDHVMDNRRVFKSYKSRAREDSAPYSTKNRARGGIFNKVKQFFGSSNEQQEEVRPKEGSRANTSVLQESARGSDHNQESPNKVLLKFFQDKGDKPLTDVEYEGVRSLLARTTNLDQSGLDTSIVFRKKLNESVDTTNDKIAISKANQTAPIVPYNQTMLKNADGGDSFSVFSTPDYRPIYHTINNSTFGSRNIPSVKRVYQFSGLPSPYRTRIKAPALKAKKRITANSHNSTVINNSSYNKPPMSNAANALLNILDGNGHVNAIGNGDNTTVSSEVDDTLKRFSNPYSSRQTIKKRKHAGEKLDVNSSSTPTKKKPAIITADDINKTIAFDKSEKLDKGEKDLSYGDKKAEEPHLLFGVKKEAAGTKPDPKIDIKAGFSADKPFINGTQNKPEPLAKKKPNPFTPEKNPDPSTEKKSDPFTTDSLDLFPKAKSKSGFSSETKPDLLAVREPQINGTKSESKPPTLNGFNFGLNPQTALFTPPTSTTSGNGATVKEANGNKLLDDLTFPDVQPIVAKLDSRKIEQYKWMFDF